MLSPDFLHNLQRHFQGEVRTDPVTRYLYSTDASIYQMQPLAVAFPRTEDDLAALVALAAEYGVPLLPRGAGSSLAGQAVGEALVIDLSRYLDRVLAIDPEAQTAIVQPGVVLAHLNRAAARYGLQFGPDPASAERATLGGVIGNNGTGAHSIRYGMAVDHLLAAEVVLADGTVAEVAPLPPDARPASPILSGLLRVANKIRTQHADVVRARWPRTWRRASGYNLNYLLPWTASAPPQWFAGGDYPPFAPDLIPLQALLAGSEGTLAVFRRLTVRLVSRPRHTALAVIPYDDVIAACEDTPHLLSFGPSAVELVPRQILRLARSVPAYAAQLTFVQGDPAALMVVEFAGDSPEEVEARAREVGARATLALTAEAQRQVWGVRKVGLGLLLSRPGDAKPISFIEDVTVPVEHLAEYVRELDRLAAAFGVEVSYYAHASAGCLHVRPVLNLKSATGVRQLRQMAEAAVDFGLRLGGAVSGEHGDGLARSEFLERAFGVEVVALFRRVKQVADPQGILNPGKIVDPPPMDRNLRYGPAYRAQPWAPTLDFSAQQGLDGAIEMCNGAGVCRKTDGLMCPSFQATREEMHSTRGRANLLRAMIAGHLPQAEDAVFRALDLCLACKGCRAECPSGVDVGKLKVEFLHRYYQSHRRRLRDWLFAHIGTLARWVQPVAPLVNLGAGLRPALRLLGIAPQRRLPRFRRAPETPPVPSEPTVLYLPDPFSRYFEPEIERAALTVLRAAGERVAVLPVVGAGRTLLSKGFLEEARTHAQRVLDAVTYLDPDGRLPVVGVEPSEVSALQDEYPDLLPVDARATVLARRAWLVEEHLLRRGEAIASLRVATQRAVWLHGHCHQKARPPAMDGLPVGAEATRALLEAVGARVEVIPSGCCGMAGAFGYEAEHYALSMQIGEMTLFPAVRGAPPEAAVLAPGASCRAQITDGTGREAVHPLVWLAEQTSRHPRESG